jgi:hypothetical protein
MDVDNIIAQISASGIELTDRRRNEEGTGWRLSFSNGALVTVLDGGNVSVSGNGSDTIKKLLDIA